LDLLAVHFEEQQGLRWAYKVDLQLKGVRYSILMGHSGCPLME